MDFKWPNAMIIYITIYIFICFVHQSSISDSSIFQKYPVSFLKYYEPLHLSSKLEHKVKMGERLIKWRKQQKVDFEFFAFRQHFHVVAQPVVNSTIAFDAIVQFHHANSSTISKLYDLGIELYSGALTDVSGSSVIGYFNRGIFQSIIILNERIYNIEPAFNYIKNRAIIGFDAIIYRDSDVKISKSGLRCDNLKKIPRHIVNPERLEIELDNFASTRKVCTLELVIDYTLYNLGKNLHNYLLHEMSTYVQFADKIFRNADFNRNSLPDNIGLQLKKITVFKDPKNKNYPFKNVIGHKNVGASDFLRATENYKNHFCLVHFFVHRSFKHIRGGMSRIGGIDGNGICMNFKVLNISMNTGITTTRIGQRIRPRLEVALSFAHGIGHGFGAFHDPKIDSNNSNNANTFLMHNVINPNSKNKILLSDFSIESISSVIHKRGPWCLINLEEPKCGNGLTELGEECDCGPKEECDKMDPNCAPQGSLVDVPCFIRRSQNKSCSARESPCCSTDGQLISRSENRVCSSLFEHCHDLVYCDGRSAECDRRILVANGEYCAGYSRTCLFGICNGSICFDRFHLEECECQSNPCDICCMKNQKCQSLTELRVGSTENIYFRKHFGEFCLNGTGYCNIDSECILFASRYQALIHINTPFFIYLIPLLLLILLSILFCFKSKKTIYSFTNERRLVANFEELLIFFEEEWKGQLESFDEQYKKNLVRLGVLFPTIPLETFCEMLKEMDEDEIVKAIISNGIPIRTDFSKNLRIKIRDLVEPFSGFRNLFRSKRILPDKSITKKSSDAIIPEIPTTPVMQFPEQISIEEFPLIQDEIIPRTTELADEDDLIKQIASDDRKIEDQMDLTETGEETIPFPKYIITEDSLPLHKTQIIPKEELIFKITKPEISDTSKSGTKVPKTTTMPKYSADEFMRKHALHIQKPDSSLLDTESEPEPEVYLLKKDSPQDIVYERMEIPSLKFISECSLPSSKPIHVSVIRPSTSKFEIRETEKSIISERTSSEENTPTKSIFKESSKGNIYSVENISEESFKETSKEDYKISKYLKETKDLPETSLITETIEESKLPSQKLEPEEIIKSNEKLVSKIPSVEEIAIERSHFFSDKVKPTSKNRFIKRLFSKDKFEREESHTSEEAIGADKIKATSAKEKESTSVPHIPTESASSKEYFEPKFIQKSPREKSEPGSKQKDRMPSPSVPKRRLPAKIIETFKPMPKMSNRVRKNFSDVIPKHLQYYSTPTRKERITFPDNILSEESSDSFYNQIISEIESDIPESKNQVSSYRSNETQKLRISEKHVLPEEIHKKTVSEEPGISSLARFPVSPKELKKPPVTKHKKAIEESLKTQELQRDLSETKEEANQEWKKIKLSPFWVKSEEPKADIQERKTDLSTLNMPAREMESYKYRGLPIPKPINDKFLTDSLFGSTSFTRKVTEDFKDRVTLAPPGSLKIVSEKVTEPLIIQPKIPLKVKIDDQMPIKQSKIETDTSEDKTGSKSPVARSRFGKKRVKIGSRLKKQKMSPNTSPEPKSPTKKLKKKTKDNTETVL